jgi:restriction system protein
MAEISRKRSGEFLRKVLEVLMDKLEGVPAKDVIKSVEDSMELTEFEQSHYPSRPNERRFDKIVRFSTIGAVKAGWLVKSKGIWYLTEEGRKAHNSFKEPEQLFREAHRLYKQWKSSRPVSTPDDEESVETASTVEEAEETAWNEIKDYLAGMNPYDFQNLIAALLRAMGYYVSWVSPPGKDGGIDILAHTDPLGTKPPRIKVQVKRRTDKVNVEGLRSFMALLGDEDVGIFVSAGGFTSDAANEARTQEKRRITLLGLEQLFDLWVEHYNKIAELEKQLLPLKAVYYLAPQE